MNPPREKHKNETIYTGDEDEKNTQVSELFAQKAEFARQIGMGKTFRMSIDQEAIQEFIIRQFLNSAHGMKIPFGAQFEAYSCISNAYLSIQKWDDKKTREVSIGLKKNAGKYKKEVLPLKNRISYLEKLIV